MRFSSFLRALPALCLAFAVMACSSTRPAQSPSAASSAASETASAENGEAAETSDLEALYWARQDSARSNYTKADVRFMRMMISHHAQALVMSDLASTNDASRSVQTLAARIINAQKDEIATMQRWLRRRDEPVPTVERDGLALRVGGMTVHGMDMVGVLTQAQIDELAAARGTEFDRLFLTYMIEHHAGAVSMVDTLFETDGAAQDDAAFKLASDINVDQKTEIERMRQMLRALPDAPDAPSSSSPDSQ